MKATNHYTAPVVELVRALVAPDDEALRDARRRAEAAGIPAIEIAPEDGALLALLVRLVRPALVVEIGTLFGYSAIWMARALPPGGHLVSIESEPGHAAVARANVAAAGLADVVEIREGDARVVLAGIPPPVDMVFVDADKVSYPFYAEWAAAALRPGGLFAADNAFQQGRVVAPDDEGSAGVRRTLELLTGDEWHAAMAPTLEGLALAVRR